MGRLYGSLFLHANMHYAEIPEERLPELAERSYRPALKALLDRPGAKVALEFSGYTLQWLAANAPDVIALTRALVARGDGEIMASTYANPILPLIPPDDGARQLDGFMLLYERLFGDVAPRTPRGFYAQEYALDATVVELVARYGMEWVVVSSGQRRISERGLLNSALQRIPPQEEFAAGEPVCHPYRIIGTRGSRTTAVTWNMPGPNDILFAWKDGKVGWNRMEAYLAGLAARYCDEQNGFLLLATADTEFVGDMPPQGSVTAERWGEAIDGFLASRSLTLATPSGYLAENPPTTELYLKCGAGARFSDLENWTRDPDNARLNNLSDDARSQIRLARTMIELVDALGFSTREARAKLAEAEQALLLADNSDGRGWKPLSERRLACYDQALNARDAAAAAIELATRSVRAGGGVARGGADRD